MDEHATCVSPGARLHAMSQVEHSNHASFVTQCLNAPMLRKRCRCRRASVLQPQLVRHFFLGRCSFYGLCEATQPQLELKFPLSSRTVGPEVIAALEPLLAPLLPALLSSSAQPSALLSLPAVTHLLTAIEQSFEPLTTRAGVVGDSSAANGGVATRFEALGTVAAWLIEQLKVVTSFEATNGQETGDGQAARDCTQRVRVSSAILKRRSYLRRQKPDPTQSFPSSHFCSPTSPPSPLAIRSLYKRSSPS